MVFMCLQVVMFGAGMVVILLLPGRTQWLLFRV